MCSYTIQFMNRYFAYDIKQVRGASPDASAAFACAARLCGAGVQPLRTRAWVAADSCCWAGCRCRSSLASSAASR